MPPIPGTVPDAERPARFRSPAHEATIGLLHTADLLRRALAAVVATADITLQQYNVLRILRGAGPDGLPTLEIAARMIEQTPGITRLLERLQRRGQVRRERCPRDRRQVTVRITPRGLAILERLDRPVADADRLLLEVLAAPDITRLIQLLDRLRAGLRPAAGRPA